MSANQEKFKELLRELFNFDAAELDFGLYRIMNAKRGEITKFLDHDLIPTIRTELTRLASGDRQKIESDLTAAFKQAESLGVDPETSPKVKELRRQLAAAVDISALENEIFSDLYNFFCRYYNEGDFISLRRYKKDTYAIPYEGEEVKLYWANYDQYYIKTSEYFRNYTFKLEEGRRVHFKVVEAETDIGNNRAQNGKDRRFILAEKDPVSIEQDEMTVRFEYRPDPEKRRQSDLNKTSLENILKWVTAEHLFWSRDLTRLAPTAKNPQRTLLEKHLTEYTARNTFDYFIHKDLGGFLRREFDFFLKNEVMHLDDIENETVSRVESYLAKLKAMRKLAHKIIELLSQIENFQKKLWLKKKFVLETNYCITLDRVPQELYPEIAANDTQREEWVKLFAIDEIKGDLQRAAYSVPLTTEFLKQNPFLVLDTKFFSPEFKTRLLKTIEDFDEQSDGLLIHSENFQALNLLQERYREQVKCIYIDPPYNTDATPILYKNDYRSSSWLSLLLDRLDYGKVTMSTPQSYAVIAIDDNELAHLSILLESIFSNWELQRVCVNHYPGSGTGRANVSRTHEYAMFLVPPDQDLLRGENKAEGWRERGFCRSGTGENNQRFGRPNSFYAVLVDEMTNDIKGIEPPPPKDKIDYPKGKNKFGYRRIYPFGEDGSERCWTLSYESAIIAIEKKVLFCTKNFVIKRLYWDNERLDLLPSMWLDKKYSAVSHGTNLLTDILGNSGLFPFPKSIFNVMTAVGAGKFDTEKSYILDYFAGSGTTAHAVINLNREDGGSRKYILVEMGDYFDTVLKPRIQKVVYSKDWKEGKPVSREGVSHCFKYLRLESYEDTLNNIAFAERTKAQEEFLLQSPEAREEYLLKYFLDFETKASPSLLNFDRFDSPFDYELQVSTGTVGETKPVKVDLVETFNYLLGLRVKTLDEIGGYRIVTGHLPNGEKTLIIWRNLRGITSSAANEALEKFFRALKYNTRDQEYDIIYVNGDNTLENLRREDQTWKVKLIEEEFFRRMFEAENGGGIR